MAANNPGIYFITLAPGANPIKLFTAVIDRFS